MGLRSERSRREHGLRRNRGGRLHLVGDGTDSRREQAKRVDREWLGWGRVRVEWERSVGFGGLSRCAAGDHLSALFDRRQELLSVPAMQIEPIGDVLTFL